MEDYHNQYGFINDSAITIFDFNLSRDRMGAIALQNGIIVDSAELLLFSSYIDLFGDGLGFITSEGDLRPMSEMVPIRLSEIDNDSLKRVFENIHAEVALGEADAIENAIDTLSSLENLTDSEASMVGSY